jgi:acyl-CoA thioesterase-1
MPCRKTEFNPQFFLSSFLLALIILGLSGCQASQSVSKPVTTGAFMPAAAATPDTRPVIVAFGDSLTAGYGLPEPESFTTLLQEKLEQHGYHYRVVNAGVSGDTSAGGLRRLEWSLEGNVKLMILELGGNDGLRGLPVEQMKKNLAQIIETAQKHKLKVVLAGMEAPPNLGEAYTREFRNVFRELAKQYNLSLIPFVLEGIGGVAGLNQPDGIHPNAAGEKIFTDNVWRVLEPVLAETN